MVGVPIMGALVIVFVIQGLRELGEPARKALIAGMGGAIGLLGAVWFWLRVNCEPDVLSL